MNKIISRILILFFISLVFSGCTIRSTNREDIDSNEPQINYSKNEDYKDDQILEDDKTLEERGPVLRAVNLSEEQKELLNGLAINTSDIFYFKYSNLTSDIKWKEIWIEHYKGEEINKNLIKLKTSTESEGKIISSFMDFGDKYKISINASSLLSVKEEKDDLTTTTRLNPYEININEDEEIILGVRIIDSESSSALIEDEIFNDKSYDYSQILKYDNVYILKVKFLADQ